MKEVDCAQPWGAMASGSQPAAFAGLQSPSVASSSRAAFLVNIDPQRFHIIIYSSLDVFRLRSRHTTANKRGGELVACIIRHTTALSKSENGDYKSQQTSGGGRWGRVR